MIRKNFRQIYEWHVVSFLLIFLALSSCVNLPVCAQDLQPLSITSVRKRLEKQTSQSSATIAAVESWMTVVTLQNNSVKPVTNVQVRYRLYMVDDEHGASRKEMKLRSIEGSENFEKLERGQKVSFETESVTLEKTQLKPGWFYTDGAKREIKDRVRGIWVKVFSDGKFLQEYINPPTLKNSDSWEDLQDMASPKE